MQKKWIVLFVIAGFLFSAPSSFALNEEYDHNAITKLARGVGNVVMAPAELVYFYSSYALDENPFMTLTAGTFYGVTYTVGRVLVGVYEIISFPCAFPNNYGPIIEPDFAYERFTD